MCSLACGQFAVEQILWNPFRWHTADMSKLTESALLKPGEQTWDSSLDEDRSVRQAIRLLDSEDAPQVSQMKRV